MNRRNIKALLFVTALFLILYAALFYVIRQDGLYRITPDTNNDRFFSMDDAYYINHFYSTAMDDTGRVVKHPLFVAFAHYFTLLERLVLGDISLEHHYMLVVLLQILVQTAAIAVLFRLLTEHCRLPSFQAVLLTVVYGLSCSALIFTLFAESYVFSGALFLFSQWFILEKRPVHAVVMGVLLGGVTITNIFIWAILVLFYDEKLCKRIGMVVAGGLGLLAVIAALPVRSVFLAQVLLVFQSSPASYSDRFSLTEALMRGFYALFGSTWFFIGTVNESPFGQYKGAAVSFIPSAPPWAAVSAFMWLLLILYSIWANRKNPLIRAPLLVLLFNITLHVIRQYGLKEGFLYSLHHSFAQVLLAACVLSQTPKPWIKKTVTAFLLLFIAVMMISDWRGFASVILK